MTKDLEFMLQGYIDTVTRLESNPLIMQKVSTKIGSRKQKNGLENYSAYRSLLLDSRMVLFGDYNNEDEPFVKNILEEIKMLYPYSISPDDFLKKRDKALSHEKTDFIQNISNMEPKDFLQFIFYSEAIHHQNLKTLWYIYQIPFHIRSEYYFRFVSIVKNCLIDLTDLKYHIIKGQKHGKLPKINFKFESLDSHNDFI